MYLNYSRFSLGTFDTMRLNRCANMESPFIFISNKSYRRDIVLASVCSRDPRLHLQTKSLRKSGQKVVQVEARQLNFIPLTQSCKLVTLYLSSHFMDSAFLFIESNNEWTSFAATCGSGQNGCHESRPHIGYVSGTQSCDRHYIERVYG